MNNEKHNHNQNANHKGDEVLMGPPGFLFGLSLLSMLLSGLVIILGGLLY